jgi:hypothetical protein
MSAAPFSAPIASPAPIATAAEAEKLIMHFVEVMDALVGVVQQETELVRGGRLAQAATLAPPKADLTQQYIAAALRLRASQTHLSLASCRTRSRRCGAGTTRSAHFCRST